MESQQLRPALEAKTTLCHPEQSSTVHGLSREEHLQCRKHGIFLSSFGHRGIKPGQGCDYHTGQEYLCDLSLGDVGRTITLVCETTEAA
ncbi:hypothetical protein PoB_006520700 [Plakobranchus ocellatus]|uniref:Uncharacterized protein n=1 Tax=Plakobranchus ocellatus TaxID=259542 RepID=A0AAV4D3E9_9GAST|nr:hypothetical protein PoB_006520700 [Plakobranchus ocellatus]